MKRTLSSRSTGHSHRATPSDTVSLKTRVLDRSDGVVSNRINHKVFPSFSSSSSFNSISDEEQPSSSASSVSGRSGSTATPEAYPGLRKALWFGIESTAVESKPKPKGSRVSSKMFRKAAKIVKSIFSSKKKKEDDSSSSSSSAEDRTAESGRFAWGGLCSSHREHDVVEEDQTGNRILFSLRELSVQLQC